MRQEDDDIEMEELHESLARSSEESTASTISRVFDEIDQHARMLPGYEELEATDSASLIVVVGSKRFKRSWIMGVLILLIIGYTAMLLSYRSLNHDGRHNYGMKNRTDATVLGMDTATTLISMPSDTPPTITSGELISLTELDVRQSRAPIPTKTYHEAVMTDSVAFVPSSDISKRDDEGLYVLHFDAKIVLKKAAVPTFESVLYPSGVFSYRNVDNVIRKVQPNGDASQLLIAAEYEEKFRHSADALWYLYDVSSKKFVQITDSNNAERLQHCSWSSDFSHVAFVQSHDIYVYEVTTGVVKRVTQDGSNTIFNGRTDWVYEEEVLMSDSALWWNDAGTKLAFLKIDNTDVGSLPLEKFSNGMFPTVEEIKYPKPGEKNPKLTMYIYDVLQDKIAVVDRDDSKFDDEWICYGSIWIGESLVVRETDRESKVLDYRVVSTDGSQVKHSIDSNTYNGWIENFNPMIVIPKNETSGRSQYGFVDIVEHEGFNHIGLFILDPMNPSMLTSGDWEVLSVDHFDSEEELLYFTANRQSHFESHIYCISLVTGELFAISDIDLVGYYRSTYSPSGRHIVLEYDGPAIPRKLLLDSTILPKSPREERSVDFTGSRSHYHTITLGDGVSVDVIEVLPPNFDKSKQHALLVNVYGGPGFRKLHSSFHIGFEDSISEEMNAVVLFIDPRGTGGQGWKYRSYAKGHIGHWEPRDVTEATRLWIQSRNYIDSEKTAIWGWSYGGFTTLKTLEFDKGETFKYGMAVAPVTDWKMYDSIYTERYMGIPKNNKDGYAESRIVDVVGMKAVKRFVIMHGTGDDNVHIQNTYSLLDKFNLKSVVNFDLMIFPDSDHSISYHNAYGVLRERLQIWLKDKFE